MYEAFYGFTGKPFQLNPDPDFYFDSSQHRRAMAFVEYGLHQSEGFIVITGEVGAGKTTLIRNTLAKLDSRAVVAAHLVSTQLDHEDILRMVAAAFGIPIKDVPKTELLLKLEALLTSHAKLNRRCLLIVDEAQNLTPRAVEELRMLSNFQLGTHALLQSFLVGQPEFRLILESPQLAQLRQRVIAACHIGPLDAAETRSYIEHRLGRVGWKDVPRIEPEAFEAVHAASGGVPRRINLVCDRVLLAGFLAEKRSFAAETVRQIAEELSGETVSRQASGQKRRISDLDQDPFAIAPPADPGVIDVEYTPGTPSVRRAQEVLSAIETESVLGQLQQLEQGLRDLQSTMLRVERGNQATLGLFRRFLDWVRSQETERSEKT